MYDESEKSHSEPGETLASNRLSGDSNKFSLALHWLFMQSDKLGIVEIGNSAVPTELQFIIKSVQ